MTVLAESASGHVGAPGAVGTVLLLGPQRRVPTLARALRDAGVAGGVAVISSGWEEGEDARPELGEELADSPDLKLFSRAERLYRRIPELDEVRQEHLRRRRQTRRLYGVRLQQIFATWQALSLRREEPELVQEQRDSLMAEMRRLDTEHLHRIDREVHGYRQTLRDRFEEPIEKQRREIRRIVEDQEAVAIAGGNVGALQETLELFDVGEMLHGRAVAGWSAGAMTLTDRVVLYHDHPPQGVGNPEVLCRGLGLARGMVALPHAAARLQIDDPARVMRMAERFAPAACVALEEGTVLRHGSDGWHAEGVRILGLDGSLRDPGW